MKKKLKLQEALSAALTEAEEANEKLRAFSESDSMTGVKNKHAWLIKEKELNKGISEGSIEEFAVVVCDVNGLKKINDTYGHKAGDEYIRAACQMVCDIFRHSPVFRVGGDEFTIILSGRDYAIKEDLMTTLHDLSATHITAGGAGGFRRPVRVHEWTG
jgi:FOG: GGDEF domain